MDPEIVDLPSRSLFPWERRIFPEVLLFTLLRYWRFPQPPKEMMMNKRNLVLALAMTLASGVASASHCPKDMKAIDAALATKPNLTTAQLTEVKKLRADGEALHKAGKHKESEDALAKGMKILNIK